MTFTVGVDVGGTKIAAGLVDDTGRIVARARRQTPADDAAKLHRHLVELITEVAGGRPVTAVGIGAAGWIDADRATVLFAAHLPWHEVDLRQQISAAVGLPVVVENDANVAAWAEHRFGAGVGAASMLMLTVGTGLGGGLVLGEDLIRGRHGVAAEFGHVRAVPDGRLCRCGRRGCLERYASGTALVLAARALARKRPLAAAGLLGLAGGDPDAVDGPMVTDAARAGDDVALAAFAEVGRWLGSALADFTQIVDPEVFVIGGGVSEAGDLLLRPVRQEYAAALERRGRYPHAAVLGASGGNDAGVIGAADLARHH